MQKNALLFGMSLDDFWYSNPNMFYLYRDYYTEKIKLENEIADNLAWEQGLYFLHSLRQIFYEAGFIKGNKEKLSYPKKSFNQIAEENKSENKANLIKQKVLARAMQIEQNINEKKPQ